MTSPTPIPNDATQLEPPLTESDEQLLHLLDRYVDSLHRRDVAAQSALIDQNPEVQKLLQCLNSLEKLAPVVELDGPAIDDSESPTILGEAADHPSSVQISPPSDLPREFGKYDLLEEIGRGGMGVIYKARQRDLDRIVAVKMILANHLASPEEVRRFYVEAKAAGSLRHSNIVGIHEVGQIDGQHYFAMDCVTGPSLSRVVRNGSVEADQAARWVAEVARAVHYLHEHQIIHRDLKPSNILLDDEGRPLVTDFGLVKIFAADSQQTRTGMIVGTPSYMAPEQAAGKPSDVSPRSDIYSLGTILYELLTGRPPFQHDNPLDTLVDVIEGEPTLPTRLNRQIPSDLELICLRCIEKDPERRYQTAAALADDLERFSRSEPVEAESAGLWQRLLRWGRREPALASRLGGILAAMLVLQANYVFAGVNRNFHLLVMSVLGIWMLLSFAFQAMLNRDSLADIARFSWAAADAVLLTVLLWLAEPPYGPILIGYPLLVVSSGMFFRVRLVAFTTVACLVGYILLMSIRPEPGPRHYPVIYGATLAVIGFVVAYQVYRLRVLSRYFEARR